jgi:hypothetical protein
MATTDRKRAKKKHRKHVEDDAQPFDPGTALEELHSAVVRLEALSQAVVSSFEFLPRIEDVSGRRALEHTHCLVRVLDEEIAKAVAMGDETVKRLGDYLKKQRR